MNEEAQEEVNGLGAGIVGEPQTEAPPTPEAEEQPPQQEDFDKTKRTNNFLVRSLMK